MSATIECTASEAVALELEQIKGRSGGILKPEDVVEFASDPATALHDWFTWDDSEAAAKYRLEEARRVIRVCVVVLENPAGEPQKVRAHVSLPEDRKLPGGGYRSIQQVMGHEDYRRQMLAEAVREFVRVRDKHRSLRELLGGVFDAIDQAEVRLTTPEV